MKAGIILVCAGWLYCCCCWIRDRPKSQQGLLISVGKRVCPGLTRRLARKVNPEHAAVMTFQDREGSDQVQYVQMMIGLWIVMLIAAGGSAILITAKQIQDADTVQTTIERPSYDEEDLTLEYELETTLNGETVQEVITIEVPHQDPTEEEAESVLDEVQEEINVYFENFDQETSTSWPVSEIDELTIQCSSLSSWIDSTGQVLWDTVETSCQAQVHVKISFYDYIREWDVSIDLSPLDTDQQDSTDVLLESVDDEIYMTDTMLVLPTESEDGAAYIWSLPSDQTWSRYLLYILWIAVLPVLIVMLKEQQIQKSILKRRQKIYHSYPVMLNQFMILMSAGVSVVKTWDRICDDYLAAKNRRHQMDPLYEEMLIARHLIRNGTSFADALKAFSDRVKVKEIRQFSSVVLTNWRRGDSQVLLHLGELHERAWEIRRNQIRKLSEEADTKLLLPLMMMLLVVIMIVLTPAMMTMTI